MANQCTAIDWIAITVTLKAWVATISRIRHPLIKHLLHFPCNRSKALSIDNSLRSPSPHPSKTSVSTRIAVQSATEEFTDICLPLGFDFCLAVSTGSSVDQYTWGVHTESNLSEHSSEQHGSFEQLGQAVSITLVKSRNRVRLSNLFRSYRGHLHGCCLSKKISSIEIENSSQCRPKVFSTPSGLIINVGSINGYGFCSRRIQVFFPHILGNRKRQGTKAQWSSD